MIYMASFINSIYKFINNLADVPLPRNSCLIKSPIKFYYILNKYEIHNNCGNFMCIDSGYGIKVQICFLYGRVL